MGTEAYDSPTDSSEPEQDRSQRIQNASTKLCTDINKTHQDEHPHKLMAGEHVLAHVATAPNPQEATGKVHLPDGADAPTKGAKIMLHHLPGNG